MVAVDRHMVVFFTNATFHVARTGISLVTYGITVKAKFISTVLG